MILKILLITLILFGILTLQVMLMAIACFFERVSDVRSWYRLYLAPILCTLIAFGLYIWQIISRSRLPDFFGNVLANIFLFIGGILLLILTNNLYEQMVGGRPWKR